MSFPEDYLFWRLADFFISEKEYRIVQLSKDQTELWLERIENKQARIVRLFRYNLDWSNWMQRDIEATASKLERIRKQLRRRDLHLVNIYVTAYPPVDDYEYRLAKPFFHPNNNKTTVSTFIVDRNGYPKALQNLGTLFNSPISIRVEDGTGEYESERYKHKALSAAVTNAREEKAFFEYGKPFFTYFFIMIQVAAFILLEARGGSTNTATLIQYGAKFNPLIIEGEWWRFFTPIVLHIGILHLLMNTMALYYLGTLVERIFGRIRFLWIYLFAGFSGSLASFVFSPELSAGASGAIFGCFGALLYFGFIDPKLFFRTMGINVLAVIAINLVFGFTVPGIDNAGHLGGLIGGFIAAGVVHFPKKKKLFLQAVFLVVGILAVSGFLRYGYTKNAVQIKPDQQEYKDLAAKINEYLQAAGAEE